MKKKGVQKLLYVRGEPGGFPEPRADLCGARPGSSVRLPHGSLFSPAAQPLPPMTGELTAAAPSMERFPLKAQFLTLRKMNTG